MSWKRISFEAAMRYGQKHRLVKRVVCADLPVEMDQEDGGTCYGGLFDTGQAILIRSVKQHDYSDVTPGEYLEPEIYLVDEVPNACVVDLEDRAPAPTPTTFADLEKLLSPLRKRVPQPWEYGRILEQLCPDWEMQSRVARRTEEVAERICRPQAWIRSMIRAWKRYQEEP